MSLRFTVSVKPNLIGKNIDMSGVWMPREMTPRDLAQWSFFEHRGYCHSVLDVERWQHDPEGYSSNRANAFFLYSEVVTVDIDSKDLEDEDFAKSSMAWFLEQDFIKRHCFMITPSSGNSPRKPNWHLSFKLDTPITDTVEYRQVALALHMQIDLPCDHQTAKAVQPTMGTLFKDEARHAAGYHWDDIYINEAAEPVSVEALRAVVPTPGSRLLAVREAQTARIQAANYQGSESANRRIEAHFRQGPEDRERVVLEALTYVLNHWPEEADYELWNQMWMSAHHGSPTERVRDLIVQHPRLYWSDGETGRVKFIHKWATHQPRDSGYTVASLFYLARRAGWLAESGYEIPTEYAEQIKAEFIPNWLATLPAVPPRLLLQSQTGSGKTQALIHLWKRLNQPKTVVLVPTVKLAADLATTLRKAGLPALMYKNLKTGRAAPVEQLQSAHVLVTTLQTFAAKIHRGQDIMHEYGLVYVEESDQLLAQFARGGGGLWSSHVSDREARAGFLALHDALQHSPVVWLVDATMSLVSFEVAAALSSKPVRYVLNAHVEPKPLVRFVEDRGRAMQLVLEALLRGERVVVPCDTKETAKEVFEAMRLTGALDGKKALCITRDSEHHADVQAFMSDVDAEAPKYDLVAYNSVMASGVSVTAVRPDVIVQFCHYLSPRANLQILNRYRKQARVYCYYTSGENFYKLTADDIHAEARRRAQIESALVSVPYLDRERLTQVRERVAAISIGDEQMQSRSPKEFYKALLIGDGRSIRDIEADPPGDVLVKASASVRASRAAMQEMVARVWPTAPLVDDENPAKVSMSDEEVAAGVRKGEILAMLPALKLWSDEAFAALTTEEATEIDRLCRQFKGYEFFLSMFAHQEQAISRAEIYLADRGRAIQTIANVATLNATLLTVRLLFPDLTATYTREQLGERAPAFLTELERLRDHYDSIISRSYHKFDALAEKYDDPVERALAMSKVILARIGLKQKYVQLHPERGQKVAAYRIDNLDDAQRFLALKFPAKTEDGLQLGQVWQEQPQVARIERNRSVKESFAAMPPDKQARVLYVFQHEEYTDFEKAVRAVEEGEIAI